MSSRTLSLGSEIRRSVGSSKNTVNHSTGSQGGAKFALSTSLSNNGCFSVSPRLVTLHAQMRFLMTKAKAPNTHKTQNSMLKSWFAFTQEFQITLPVGGWGLAMYATDLVVKGKVTTADSLANYVSAVKQYHSDLGMDCPTPTQFGPLNRVIQGLRGVAQRPTRRSLPVTPEILFNLLNTRIQPPFCPLDAQILHIYKILSLVYYLTMLRSSSLVPKTYKDVDPVRLLCWGNIQEITFQGTPGVLLQMYKTKTIQNCERIQEVPLAQNDECPALCPVCALRTLKQIIGVENIGPDTPVFQSRDYQGKLRPVLYSKFNAWYKFRLSEMGLDSKLYTLHGFRHGGIQQALMSEGNLALVKITSDHSSDVILEYSNVPADRRLTISRKVNSNLTTFVLGSSRAAADLPSWVLAHL